MCLCIDISANFFFFFLASLLMEAFVLHLICNMISIFRFVAENSDADKKINPVGF